MGSGLAAAAEQTGSAPARWGRLLRIGREEGAWSPSLLWPTALAVALTLFVAADLVADVFDRVPAVHLAVESGCLLLCLAGVWGTGRQLRLAVRRARELHLAAERSRADLDRLGAEVQAMAAGVGALIDLQFARWRLTAAEREVGLLILKGLSYKEVAEARATSEHTVRNQACAIYRKAGLGSRTDMAAHFLEDLLAPARPVLRVVQDRAAGSH